MTTTSEENTRLSVLEAKVDGIASGVSHTHDRINQVETRINQVETRIDDRFNQVETRINQVESRMDSQFLEVRQGQRQIFLAIVTAGTTVTLALVGIIATLALGAG